MTGSWEELVKKLQDGEIDLMSALSYTDERAETMLFSDQPMGKEKYYLYVDLANSDISVSDLSTFKAGVRRPEIRLFTPALSHVWEVERIRF